MPSSNPIAPPSSTALFQLSTVNSRLFSSNSFRMTYFRKNASANPYGSHTYKTKDLKPFRFTYLQKKGGGTPCFPPDACVASSASSTSFASSISFPCVQPPRRHESRTMGHERVMPVPTPLVLHRDSTANTSIAFFEQDESQTHMFDVLGDHRAEMAAIIKPSKDPLLFVAPGRLALAKLEQQLAGQFDAPFKLKDALTPLLKDYEYIVMDTPPSLGILTVNAMVAATHLIVPIQAAYFAIEGTDDLLETYERIRARPNPSLKVLGVLITLFDKRTNISKDTHGQIRTVFGSVLFKTRISKNVRLEESPAYKETIFTFPPKSPGTQEYRKLALEVIQRVQENRLARHAEDAA